jgi:hypothetical protein
VQERRSTLEYLPVPFIYEVFIAESLNVIDIDLARVHCVEKTDNYRTVTLLCFRRFHFQPIYRVIAFSLKII